MQSTVRTIKNLDKILEDKRKDPRVKKAEELELQAKQLRESVSEEVFETALYKQLNRINQYLYERDIVNAKNLVVSLINKVSERL